MISRKNCNWINHEEVIDPITITVNAGACLSAPESASIAPRKIDR